MGPAGIRPDWLWPDDDTDTRMSSPEWFDPEDGRLRPPPAFAELFVPGSEAPVLTVGYDGAHSAPLAGSTDERIARTVRWPIPRIVLSEAVYELLATLAPLAGQIAEGLSVDKSPRGFHQRLTPGAETARAELGQRLDDALAGWPVVEVHTITDFDEAALESAVTADTRDEDLPAIAETLRARIVPARPGNIIVLDQADEALTHARDAARAQVRDRLAIVAGLASGDRRERDDLLRRITAWDNGADSYRALGKMTGLSHTAIRAIVKQATTDRDTALDHLDATVRSLRLAWDPPRLPAAVRDDAGWPDDEPSDSEQEQQERDDDDQRRAHLRLKSCAACGQPSRRIVRRWQVGKVSFAADPDDPHRDQYGHVSDLSQPPSFSSQPSWGACGTVCARRIIDEDRASPSGGIRVAGNDEFFYDVESFSYLPHDSELPDVLVRLRRNLDLTGYSRDEIGRAVAAGDTARAASHLASLRRDIARTAATLAAISTWTPPGRRFPPGTPEPGDAGQVRHATPSTATGDPSAPARTTGKAPTAPAAPGTS